MLIGAPVGFFGAATGGSGGTFDATYKGTSVTLSDGNLSMVSSGAAWGTTLSTTGHNSGKWYFEILLGSSVNNGPGLANRSINLNIFPGQDINGWVWNANAGAFVNNNNYVSAGGGVSSGDVVGIALDMSSGNAWFAKNNTWANSGNPATGANPSFTGLTGTIYAACGAYDSSTVNRVRLSSGFSYSPPSGFSSW
jgi:hypothetical protein